jgi:hypothetical protein
MSWAQKFELMPFVGYRTSGSFDVESLGHSRFTITDGLAFGLTFGILLNPNTQIELMWSQTNSNVRGSLIQPAPVEDDLFEVNTSQFHVNFMYLFPASSTSRAIPHIFAGLGLTYADPKGEAGGETRFSFALGAGLKLMASERVGFRFQAKWNPTFVNTSSQIWCDWWGFCYAIPVSQYMSQFEFTGGIFFRF